MELVTFTAAQVALLGTAVMGATELITRLRAKDLWVVATIVTSAVIGGLFALYYKVDFISGVVAGFSASGFLKALGSVGNKSTPAPSSITEKSK